LCGFVDTRSIISRTRSDAEFPIDPRDSNYSGEVADRFRDGSGEIGIIASISVP
jgi:hypothetical protein